MVVHQNR